MASAASDSDKIPRRDEILASFQDITGIDDVNVCIQFLENNQWKLQDAIETALAVGGDLRSIGVSSASVGVEKTVDDVEMLTAHDLDSAPSERESINPFRALLTRDDSADDLYSRQPPFELDSYPGAGPRRRMLHFDVSYRGSQYEFAVRDDETIGDLKRYIAKELAPTVGRLESKDMDLRGWRAVGQPDDATLHSLHLPSENSLELLTPNRASSSTDSTANGSAVRDKEKKTSATSRQFRLDVYDKENDRTHQLTVPGSRTMGDIKRDVYALINLLPSQQAWTGWPRVNGKLDDCTTLSEMKLDVPVHRLRVERVSTAAVSKAVESNVSDDEESVDVLNDDAMDDSVSIEDHHLSPAAPIDRQHQVPLIPADFSSPQEAIENFLRVYESRYGENHPLFFPTSLEDALRDSCQVKASRRKPLLIYLHDDASVSAHVFSTQVLSTPAVADFLNQNFIVWAWDCTLQENKNKFLVLLSTQLGSIAYELRQLEHDRYPVLLFVHKARGALEVEHVIKAPCSLDELMGQLMHALDSFTRQNRLDVIDEEEREAREKMRTEQEKAYRDSLNADRMKAEQKRLEQERLLTEQRSKEEEAAKIEKDRQLLAEQLPSEPPENAKSITTIRLRLPNAEIVERRFLVREKLSTLLKFAASKGYGSDKFRLLTNYPKRDLASLDVTKSFEELKLCPRETVVVEEK